MEASVITSGASSSRNLVSMSEKWRMAEIKLVRDFLKYHLTHER